MENEESGEILSKFRMMLMMSINFMRGEGEKHKNLNEPTAQSALIKVWRMSGIEAVASLKAFCVFFSAIVTAPKKEKKNARVNCLKAFEENLKKLSHGSGSNAAKRARLQMLITLLQLFRVQ